MCRRLENFIACALLDKYTVLHNSNFVGDIGNHTQVMTDKYNADITSFLQFLEQLEDLRLNSDIQCRGWFIGYDYSRLGHQRHGNNHSLTHAAGKFKGPGLHTLGGIFYPDLFKNFDAAFPGFLFTHAKM